MKGKTDVRDLMGAVGISRSESDRILQEVRANQARLDACQGPHDFGPIDSSNLPRTYRCSKCGGTVSTVHAIWYKKGLEHGRRQG